MRIRKFRTDWSYYPKITEPKSPVVLEIMKFNFLESQVLVLVLWFATPHSAFANEQSEQNSRPQAGETSISQTRRWRFGKRLTPIVAESRAGFKCDMYAYLLPDEWEFLGKNCQELHDLYDKMSPCKLSKNRFWFGGCGGIEGGGFFQVEYGADGQVNEVYYCASTCTSSFYGPRFTDRIEALNYAIYKANRKLRDCFDSHVCEEPMPHQFYTALHSRLRAHAGLGKLPLCEEDARSLELLKPLHVREKLLSRMIASAGKSDLVKWKKEILRNGIRIQSLSQSIYKLTDSTGKSFKLKANGLLVSNWEQAEWFVSSAISKETKELMKTNIRFQD